MSISRPIPSEGTASAAFVGVQPKGQEIFSMSGCAAYELTSVQTPVPDGESHTYELVDFQVKNQ